jgi:hypothetical protein
MKSISIKASCFATAPRLTSVFSMTEYLRQLMEGNEKWGWVIYRTVYTPESDQQWEDVMKRLDELALANFDESNMNSTNDRVVGAAVRAKYGNIILDDKEKFNNAPWELLEQHYNDWVPTASPRFPLEHYKNAMWKGFLVIDETSIPKILNAPTAWQEQESKFEEPPQSYSITFVGLAEEPDNYEFDYETGEEHYLDEEDPDFDIIAKRSWPGHFPASIFNLYSLWEELSYNGVWAEEYVPPETL